MATLTMPPAMLFIVLFIWGGTASGIYPVALSIAGDRFRGGDLVSVNAAMIIAYGLGGLVGPPLGGIAMGVRNTQGLLWLFVILFGALVSVLLIAPQTRRSGPPH